MRRFVTVFAIVMASVLLLCLNANATIRYVDANTNNTLAGVFHDIPSAYAGSNNGDTIYLAAGSYTTSSAFTSTKQLHWIGSGSTETWIGVGSNAGGSFTFAAGSEGSSVTGLQFAAQYTTGSTPTNTINFLTSGCTIQRVLFYHFLHFETGGTINTGVNFTGSNLVIQDCFFDKCQISSSSSTSNMIFRNNIVSGSLFDFPSGTGIFSFYNNYVASWQTYGQSFASLIHNLDFFNNILYETSIPSGVSWNIYNNISNITSGLPTGNGNLSGIAPSTLFSNQTTYTLSTTSPARGSGYGGVDCGIYGGPTPFVWGCYPPIPTITSVTGPGSGTPTSTITINVTASAHP